LSIYKLQSIQNNLHFFPLFGTRELHPPVGIAAVPSCSWSPSGRFRRWPSTCKKYNLKIIVRRLPSYSDVFDFIKRTSFLVVVQPFGEDFHGGATQDVEASAVVAFFLENCG
jgi:hypothetical protein